ncbi:MAG: hypothetical protein QOK02_2883 [Mycobacterium sp.]|jgi:hypothetical protein|nr:hypothetical protein [Mycobacterium sp.]
MSHHSIVSRCQLVAAATAIGVAGFFTVSAPAHARPMLPLAPGACSQYAFNGNFSLKQANGETVVFSSIGPAASGNASARGNFNGLGTVNGGIQGDKLDFTIVWNANAPGTTAPSQGDYTGYVSADGFAHGDTIQHNGPFGDAPNPSAHWDSLVPLVCTTPAASAAAPAAPPPPASSAAAAAARLAVNATGPATLKAGMTGTYTVTVSNPGDLSAPVELFISFNGNLQQTGQPAAAGGFDCTVNNYAGGTSSVHCTVGQFGSKATANITVQGQGSAPGAGQLVVNINSSDPAAQFVQKSQQLNVTIT